MRRKNGFTLIELLVVVAVIGVLSSIIVVNLNYARDKGRIAKGELLNSNIYNAAGANAIGFWKFNEGSGTAITDSSGNGNVGVLTYSTSPWSTDVPDPNMIGSLYFDGSGSSYVSIPYSHTFDLGVKGFTYLAWIKPTAIPNAFNMFMGQNGLPYFDVRNNGFLHFSFNASGQQNVTGVTTVTLGKWHQVAAIYDANGMVTLYLDGNLEVTAGPFTALVGSANPLDIGIRYPGDAYPFSGYVDNVVFINNAVGIAEIKKNYAEGLAIRDR
jgi:prepilin-type N-terminal cleavage/methylation domain-containing protein